MTPTFDRRRGILRPAAVAIIISGLVLAAGLASPAPAGAHARVTSITPADGSHVDSLPDRVVVNLAAKPATIEGDPLMVYDPTGRRIDAGDVRVDAEGWVLSVGIAPGVGRSAGRYELVYRVVSADTHLIAGRVGFTLDAEAAATTTGWMNLMRPEPDYELGRAGPADLRPELLAGAALAAVGVRRVLRPARPRPGRLIVRPAVRARPCRERVQVFRG